MTLPTAHGAELDAIGELHGVKRIRRRLSFGQWRFRRRGWRLWLQTTTLMPDMEFREVIRRAHVRSTLDTFLSTQEAATSFDRIAALVEGKDREISRLREERYTLQSRLAGQAAEIARLRGSLIKIAKETIYTYDDGNEGPYIKIRAKYCAQEALAQSTTEVKS